LSELTDIFIILAYTVPLAIGSVFSAKIILNRPKKVDKYAKKLDLSRDEYIEDLEDQLDSLKHTLSSRERGPKVEGESGDLGNLLPELIGSFESFVPKWLKPIIANKDIQSVIIDKVQKEPEKFANLFGKLIGHKTIKEGSQDQGGAL